MSSIHPFIEQFIVAQNIPLESVILLLLLPIIATLVAFFRQIVGIKAFGIYTPSLIIFSFLVIGLKYGVSIYIGVIVIGMLSRFLLKKLRILYLSRVAITLSIISFAFLGLLIVGAMIQRTGFASISIVPLLIMIVITEKFIAAQIEKDTKTAILMAGQTLIVSLVVFYIVSWPTLINMLLLYPWGTLLTLPINILLGKWSGLRITEYFRFRTIIGKE